MIDTHCHILPVDDGAKDMEESIKMARVAQKDGIKKIINHSKARARMSDDCHENIFV